MFYAMFCDFEKFLKIVSLINKLEKFLLFETRENFGYKLGWISHNE